MTQVSEDGPTGLPDHTDDDTVELPALPEFAAAAANDEHICTEEFESTTVSPAPAPALAEEMRRAHRAAFVRRWPVALAAAALGIAGGIALWATAQRATERHSSPPAVRVSVPVPIAPAAAPPSVPAEPPVQFRNPFDASEVFEFPPGTSRSEARERVAELLLQRAQERVAGAQDAGHAAAEQTTVPSERSAALGLR